MIVLEFGSSFRFSEYGFPVGAIPFSLDLALSLRQFGASSVTRDSGVRIAIGVVPYVSFETITGNTNTRGICQCMQVDVCMYGSTLVPNLTDLACSFFFLAPLSFRTE